MTGCFVPLLNSLVARERTKGKKPEFREDGGGGDEGEGGSAIKECAAGFNDVHLVIA